MGHDDGYLGPTHFKSFFCKSKVISKCRRKRKVYMIPIFVPILKAIYNMHFRWLHQSTLNLEELYGTNKKPTKLLL